MTRVLLTIAGFVAIAAGLIELGPLASAEQHLAGAGLILIGLLAWTVVWRRRTTGRAVPITAGVLALVTAAGLAAALVPADLPVAAAPGLNAGAPTPPEPEPTGYVRATDGTRLAYFADVPQGAVATLVFYHGSGANEGAGYLDFGRRLAEQYHIATYLFDMRGHGASGGRRGDAPSEAQMFADTAAAVAFVKGRHPGLPEYAGGHSAGAGLLLNSADRINGTVAGFVFLAPDFGLHSDTERQSEAGNFATISHRVLIADIVTNGLLDRHSYAVAFAYTREQIDREGMVARYTTTMAIAQNAGDSAAILARTGQPVGVWIGADDEVFDPAKVSAWARNAPRATVRIVPGTDHLGVVDKAADEVGAWLDRAAGA